MCTSTTHVSTCTVNLQLYRQYLAYLHLFCLDASFLYLYTIYLLIPNITKSACLRLLLLMLVEFASSSHNFELLKMASNASTSVRIGKSRPYLALRVVFSFAHCTIRPSIDVCNLHQILKMVGEPGSFWKD